MSRLAWSPASAVNACLMQHRWMETSAVNESWSWFTASGDVDLVVRYAIRPSAYTAEQRARLATAVKTTSKRLATDQVAVWLLYTDVAVMIADQIDLPADRAWTIAAHCLPPRRSPLTADAVAHAERVLNDVRRGRAPEPFADLGADVMGLGYLTLLRVLRHVHRGDPAVLPDGVDRLQLNKIRVVAVAASEWVRKVLTPLRLESTGAQKRYTETFAAGPR